MCLFLPELGKKFALKKLLYSSFLDQAQVVIFSFVLTVQKDLLNIFYEWICWQFIQKEFVMCIKLNNQF